MADTHHFEAKLKKSSIGRPAAHRRILEALGIRGFGKTVSLKDTPSVRGMLYKVNHLVEVSRVDGPVV